MKIKYFEDTDTALLELSGGVPVETRELSENIYVDLDEAGRVVSITIEHAGLHSDLSEVIFERISRADEQPSSIRAGLAHPAV